MTNALKIALVQINPTVGDVAGNVARIRAAYADAAKLGADLAVFSELCVSGYPPEDLVYRNAFLDRVAAGVNELAAATANGPAMIVGAPWRGEKPMPEGPQRAYNAALLLDAGKVQTWR